MGFGVQNRIRSGAARVERTQERGDIEEVKDAVAGKVSNRVHRVERAEERGDIEEVERSVPREVRGA